MKTSICRYSAYTPKPVQNQPNFTAQSRALFPRPPETTSVASPRSPKISVRIEFVARSAPKGSHNTSSAIVTGISMHFQTTASQSALGNPEERQRKGKGQTFAPRDPQKSRGAEVLGGWADSFSVRGFKQFPGTERGRGAATVTEFVEVERREPGRRASPPESHPTIPVRDAPPGKGPMEATGESRLRIGADWTAHNATICKLRKGTRREPLEMAVVYIWLLCDGQ